jgi:glutathione synthase/RimK-type ligase-like ATP-grasp enzyme
MPSLAIFHEHPDWFRPLFAELDARGIPYVRLDASAHLYDPAEHDVPYSLVFNRASPSAYLRGHSQTIFNTLDWLRHLARLGVPVVNGAAPYEVEISKALQLGLLAELGLPYPRTRVVNHPTRTVEAARALRYPVLVKANIGGSGAGITSFASEDELALAAAEGALDFGVDGTALVQEHAPLRGGHISRVETLGGNYLYAINVYPAEGFNLCPADICQTTDGQSLIRGACALDAPKNGMRVERADPPARIIRQVETIARRTGLDVGGIEYLIDDRDGQHYFYDINALSNFVADAVNVIGFDPHARLVDYLESRLAVAAGSELSAPGHYATPSVGAGVGGPAGAFSSLPNRFRRG